MDSLAQKVEAIDALFSEWDRPDSPGCAVSISFCGRVVHSRGYGMADLEHAVPIATNTVFDIGSISKQFTATSIALLARQGSLSLDDDVRKYIPELPHYGNPITIRHLIHHTSGLRDYTTLMELAGMYFTNYYDGQDIIDVITRQKALNFQPGEDHLYSNTGYLLLAYIVKRVTGKSLREFADENIFSPLGMKSTFFHDDFSEIILNRAIGYSPRKGDGFGINMSIFDVVGGGGAHATIEDLRLWNANFCDNVIGGFGQDLIADITTPATLNSGEILDYAFGLRVSCYRGLKVVGHDGAWAGYRSAMMRFPERQLAVIILCNLHTIDPQKLSMQIADIMLEQDFADSGKSRSQAPQQFVELSAASLEDRAGFYWNPKTGTIWQLKAEAQSLAAEVYGMSFMFKAISGDFFKSVDGPFAFSIEFENHGSPTTAKMRLRTEDEKLHFFDKIVPDFAASHQLEEYAGNYYCEELCCHYDMMVDEGKLFLCKRNFPREALQPLRVDFFKTLFCTFDFIRNAQNEVVGLKLDMGRVRNLHFLKQ